MAETAENRESQTSATAVDKLPANESVDFDHLSRQLSDYFVDSRESPPAADGPASLRPAMMRPVSARSSIG